MQYHVPPTNPHVTGCLLEQHTVSHGGLDLQASARLAARLLAGLKPCMLQRDVGRAAAGSGGGGSSGSVRLMAVRLVGAVAAQSHPRLVQQLIAADVCEYLFEVLRAAAGAGGAGGGRGGVGAAGTSEDEEVARAAVVALSYLAVEGKGGRACQG